MSTIRSTLLTLALVVALGAAACDEDSPVVAPSPTSSPTSPAPAPSPTPASPSPEPSPESTPEPVVAEHGGTYWGVYLAVGGGPDLEDAIAYLTTERGLRFGSEFSIGDLSCDTGAAEALGAEGPMRVAVYFETQQDAEAWADTLPGPPVGIAEVQTLCLD